MYCVISSRGYPIINEIALSFVVDSLHGIILLIPRASYLISVHLPYLSIVEFYFINVQAVLCSVRSYNMAVDNY